VMMCNIYIYFSFLFSLMHTNPTSKTKLRTSHTARYLIIGIKPGPVCCLFYPGTA